MPLQGSLSPRMQALVTEANAAIGTLGGVRATDRDSFRIGKKVFVRLRYDADAVQYGFKLPKDEARAACKASDKVRPMQFGGMGTKGWVEVELRRKTDLAKLIRLVRRSRSLYP